MDFHFFLFFGGQFRVFGDSVCVKKRTGGVCGGRYRISLSFSLFCIREKERERGVCFGAEEREKSAEKK